MDQLFFMHIPKTAGTSVHDALRRHYRKSRVPRDFASAWREHDRFDKYDFLGGHVILNQFIFVAAASKRDEAYRAVSFVRQPVNQLASHLAWVRNIAEPESKKRFHSSPKIIQSLSLRLQTVDLSNPAELRKFFDSMSQVGVELFDNCMTRYFTAIKPFKRVTEADAAAAIKAFEKFDCIGVVERYDDSMRLISKLMGWPEPKAFKKKNSLPNRFGLDVGHDEIRELFEPYTKYDALIYEAACKRIDEQFKEHGLLSASV